MRMSHRNAVIAARSTLTAAVTGLVAAAAASTLVAPAGAPAVLPAPPLAPVAASPIPVQTVPVNTSDTSAPAPVELSYRGLRADEEPTNGLKNPYRGYRLMTEYQAKDLSHPFDAQEDTRTWNGLDKTNPDNFTPWRQPADIRQALPMAEAAYDTRDQNVTQLYFYLTDYVCRQTAVTAGTCDPATYFAGGLPQVALDNISTTLARLAETGYTAVLRFVYETDNRESVYSVAKIKQHIDQLAPIVNTYRNVVANWQMGFVGAWGEWSSVNPTGCQQSNPADTCTPDLVTYLVRRLPDGVDTTIRYLTMRSALAADVKARAGYADDAFLESCCGLNYNDPTLKADSKNLFNDCEMFWNSTQLGNTDPYATDTINDPMAAIRRSQTVHCTTANRSHNPLSHRHWKTSLVAPRAGGGIRMTSTTIQPSSSAQPVNLQGNPDAIVAYSPDYFLTTSGTPTTRTAYDFMRDHLGYRLQLDRATLGTGRGTSLPVHLELRNFGFATPRRPSAVKVVVLDANGVTVRSATANTDWRTWYGANEAEYTGPNGVAPTHAVDATLDLAGLAPGSYRLGLRFEGASSLPALQVRLANGGAVAWTGQENVFAGLSLNQPLSPQLAGTRTMVASGKALDVPGHSTTGGTQLITWAPTGAANQRWQFTAHPDGTYSIKGVESGLCMDVNANSLAAGAKVIQWTCSGTRNQRWTVEPATGGYRVRSLSSGLLLTTASTSNGALVTQQPATDAALQVWAIT
jgi:hypothetical protein